MKNYFITIFREGVPQPIYESYFTQGANALDAFETAFDRGSLFLGSCENYLVCVTSESCVTFKFEVSLP